MSEKGKEARRAYKREWARRNPDKIREQQRRYWERRAAAAEARQQESQQIPPEQYVPRASYYLEVMPRNPQQAEGGGRE